MINCVDIWAAPNPPLGVEWYLRGEILQYTIYNITKYYYIIQNWKVKIKKILWEQCSHDPIFSHVWHLEKLIITVTLLNSFLELWSQCKPDQPMLSLCGSFLLLLSFQQQVLFFWWQYYWTHIIGSVLSLVCFWMNCILQN